jgi:hypothetical protein
LNSSALVSNAATLWTELQDHRKRRLHELLFPRGVSYDGSRFGTPDPCWFFRLNQPSEAGLSGVASLMPASWNQIAGWLKQIDNLRQAA